MTLKEAKDKVAQNHSYDEWEIKIYENGPEFMEMFWEQVANFYARGKWYEACEAQKEVISELGVIALLKAKPEFKP